MPTPVGHALGGLAVYYAARKAGRPTDRGLLTFCLAASLAPDLDFAIGPLAGRSLHHYFTHSLAFAGLAFLGAYLLARFWRRRDRLREAALAAAAYLSHIGLDLLARDTAPPFGVELFWPVSDRFFISPVRIFTDVWRGSLAVLFGLHNWLAVAQELSILGPVVFFFWWRSRPRAPQPE